MDFPDFQKEGSMAHTTVAADEEYPACFQVFQGTNNQFRPAGLPAPDWAIIVNPMGYDDPESIRIDLCECFEPNNQDVVMTLVRGSLDDTKRALWEQAKADADSHVECGNGGAYALWALENGVLLVAGFDNGGSDIAQSACEDAARLTGEILMSAGVSHYDPKVVMNPELHNGLSNIIDAGVITRQLLQQRSLVPTGPGP